MPRQLTALLLAACLLPSLRAHAQNVTPEVQALYQQAQQAAAANQPEAAVRDYRRIIALAPDLAPAYNNLGRLLFNLNRFPEAIDMLLKGLTLKPDMAPASMILGASYLEQGQYQQALGPLQTAVQALPEDHFARMSLVRTLLALNKPDEAVVQLNTLLAADPKDQQAWYLSGKLHLQLSEQAFAQVQKLDPNTAIAHIMEGEVMESMQNTSGAVAAYKQAIAAAGDDPTPLEHLADAYWHTGDWTHAREQLGLLTAREPANCAAHWKLANSLDELGVEPDIAGRELKTALAACPDLAQARAERARLLIRTGHAKDAIPDLEAAEKLAPDEPSVQQLYAQAWRALGDKPKADAASRRFLALEAAMHKQKEDHAHMVIQANQ